MINLQVLTNNSSYFPGDNLYSLLSFSSSSSISILWSSIQLFGCIELDKNWKFKGDNNEHIEKQSLYSIPDYSLSNNHYKCIFITKPTILECDISIDKHNSKMFLYHLIIPKYCMNNEIIPPSYPPDRIHKVSGGTSFDGITSPTSIRVNYYLSIVLQTSTNKQPQIINIPIRILSTNSLNEKTYIFNEKSQLLDIGDCINVQLQDQSAIESLFLCNGYSIIHGIKDASEDFLLLRDNKQVSKVHSNIYHRKISQFLPCPTKYKQQIINELLETNEDEFSDILKDLLNTHELYKQKENKSSSYRISFEDDTLVQISLTKDCYKIGENISGTLKFNSSCICYQVSITLEQQEVLNITNLEKITKNAKDTKRIVFAESYEYTQNILETHFLLGIPIDGSQEIHTNLMKITWQLHFQFIVGKKTDNNNIIKPKVEILNWILPIQVIIYDYPQHLHKYQKISQKLK